jgi:hypothetical protein
MDLGLTSDELSVQSLYPMCGRLRVGKAFLTHAALVGAAMCSAFECGSRRSREDALTIVTNVTDQPLFGQEDCPIWPQLSDALPKER